MNRGNWSETFRCLENEELYCCHGRERWQLSYQRGDFSKERVKDLDK